MLVTFGYVHNTRTELVVFDIVDMEYPYNAIIGRGMLNDFEAILHPAYLCMKIPSEQGPIAVHGSQEVARRAEGSWTDSKAIHNIDEAEATPSTDSTFIESSRKHHMNSSPVKSTMFLIL
jgi:hypothetical protein